MAYISTGGAMPSIEIFDHASSEDLMVVGMAAFKAVAERNGMTIEEFLNILLTDELNAKTGG